MATIAISDLHPAGSTLFSDSESYLNELSDRELNETQGGSFSAFIFLLAHIPATVL